MTCGGLQSAHTAAVAALAAEHGMRAHLLVSISRDFRECFCCTFDKFKLQASVRCIMSRQPAV